LWRARKLRGPNCEACGTKRRLHAHHVDGNQANNTSENIQTLCNNCHNFWHAALERAGLPTHGRMPRLFDWTVAGLRVVVSRNTRGNRRAQRLTSPFAVNA
jgi:hypothetical protein